MSRSRAIIRALVLAALLTACEAPADRRADDAEPSPAADSIPAYVNDVAGIANAVERQPAAADSILAAHDMARAAFDSLIYEIAADPALTAAYEAARRD